MEQLAETITLDVEESNELAFKIKVEGSSTPVKVRLVCESPEISYMFPGRGTQEDGVVQFVIPQMKGKIQEGLYSARVEVLVENRYFSPVQFQLNFKKTMRVFAEAIQIVQPTKQEIKVSAVPLVVQQPIAQQVVIQQPVQTVQQKTIVKEQEYVLENPFINEKKQITNISENKLPISKVSTKNKQKTLREKFASKNK